MSAPPSDETITVADHWRVCEPRVIGARRCKREARGSVEIIDPGRLDQIVDLKYPLATRTHIHLGKRALISRQRYAHVKQFERAKRASRKYRIYLGRVIRGIGRKIAGDVALREIFAKPLSIARRVREQRQRGPKMYSLRAPTVECIGKGKPHLPYAFGAKVSTATPLHRCGAVRSSRVSRRCRAILTTANAVLAAAGYNFGLIFAWLATVLRVLYVPGSAIPGHGSGRAGAHPRAPLRTTK